MTTTLGRAPIAKEQAIAAVLTAKQRLDIIVHNAAEFIASTITTTGKEPTTSAGYDQLFTDAGISPTTETRMASVRAGRQLYADRQESQRRNAQQATEDFERRVVTATRFAKADLERIIKDPRLGLDDIFSAVIAVRRASGHVHPMDAVTFEAAVERAVQVRSATTS